MPEKAMCLRNQAKDPIIKTQFQLSIEKEKMLSKKILGSHERIILILTAIFMQLQLAAASSSTGMSSSSTGSRINLDSNTSLIDGLSGVAVLLFIGYCYFCNRSGDNPRSEAVVPEITVDIRPNETKTPHC